MDWSMNEYFNCSSPSREQCGVPYSCCINATNIAVSLSRKRGKNQFSNFPIKT